MSEQDVREGLRVAVAEEPPLDLDPSALIAAARKASRRKRSLLSVGVATTVIAVAAVAVPVVLAPSPAPPASSAPSSAPSSGSSLPWPPPSVAPKHYTAKQLIQRGKEMRGRLEQVLPVIVPAASDFAVGAFQGEAAGDIDDGQDYLNAFAAFTLDGRRYAVGISVFAPGAFSDGPADLCAPSPSRCTMLSDRRLAFDEPLGEANADLKIVSVYDFRPDGSVTSAAAYNYDPTGTKRITVAEIPLTVAQLTSLSTDLQLGL